MVEQKGFHIDQHAEAYHKLMLALGYDEYGTCHATLLSLNCH